MASTAGPETRSNWLLCAAPQAVTEEFIMRYKVEGLGPRGRRVAESVLLDGSARNTGRMVQQERVRSLGGSLASGTL